MGTVKKRRHGMLCSFMSLITPSSHCIVILCTVLCCAVLWCAVRCAVLCCGVVWCGVLCCGAVLCYALLCCVGLCCAVLLCRAVLCYGCVVLCCNSHIDWPLRTSSDRLRNPSGNAPTGSTTAGHTNITASHTHRKTDTACLEWCQARLCALAFGEVHQLRSGLARTAPCCRDTGDAKHL